MDSVIFLTVITLCNPYVIQNAKLKGKKVSITSLSCTCFGITSANYSNNFAYYIVCIEPLPEISAS